MRLTEAEYAALLQRGHVREVGPAPVLVPGNETRLSTPRQGQPFGLPMTEKQVQSQLMAVATKLQFLSYHTYNSKRSAPGYPDVTLVRPGGGVLYHLECKIETESPTLAQQRWLDALGQVSCVVAGVVQPSTLQQWVRRIQEES